MPTPTTQRGFIDEDFLLHTAVARELYHAHAAQMPILDYHCHLSPQAIASNYAFANLTDIWLRGDHYKWRAMRTNGIAERYITGAASDYEKFEQWAHTVPYTLRNPLYHWTHMELRHPFGLQQVLSGSNARQVYDHCTAKLQEPAFSTQGLLQQFGVQLLCTTDDPTDDLAAHRMLQQNPCGVRVLPTFRPDQVLCVGSTAQFNTWVDALGVCTNRSIARYHELLEALDQRMDYFHQMGCRLADHGLINIPAEEYTAAQVTACFDRLRAGGMPEPHVLRLFASAVLLHLAQGYHKRGWVQQFHLGALRNTNARLHSLLGADSGADSVGDERQARHLAKFMGSLDERGQLARTILYNLNPADNEVFATMIGNYQDGSMAGKIQYGSAWWFLDQKDGMEKQLNALSNMGLLSRFVGMVTDSRSFLSYSRHEYFRRILCNLIGQDVANGELPADMGWLGSIVRRICYDNAVQYFSFPE